MPITPPKCRTCGVVEWKHLCRGRVDPKELAKQKPQPKAKRQRGGSVKRAQ